MMKTEGEIRQKYSELFQARASAGIDKKLAANIANPYKVAIAQEKFNEANEQMRILTWVLEGRVNDEAEKIAEGIKAATV